MEKFDESKVKRDESGQFAEKGSSITKAFDDLGGARKRLSEILKTVSTTAVNNLTSTLEAVTIKITDNMLGEEFIGLKGRDAINKLIQEKRGHVKAAFHREDIGDVDLIWGDKGSGLYHILQQREKQGGVDIPKFLDELTDVIENGEFIKINEHGRYEYFKDKKVAIISRALRNGKLTYLFTAFKTRKAPRNDGA